MASKKTGPPTHPPYNQMIKEAIAGLKERGGSSLPAIKNYVGAAYKLPEGWEKRLSLHLKRMTAGGKLVKIKGSWKLGEGMKAAKPKATKSTAVKKRTASAKPAVAKKPKKPKAKKAKVAGVKKAMPAKPKAAAKPKVKKAAKKATAPKKAGPKKAPMKKTVKKAAPKKK